MEFWSFKKISVHTLTHEILEFLMILWDLSFIESEIINF